MNENKVSIIIPIYNGEKTLDLCLNSIKNQTYKNFEVLMIDDGSKDSTKDICLNYSNLDNRFLYFYKDNGGVSSARNLGLKYATGEYISFVDCDDTIEKEYLQYSISQLENNNCDISVVRFNITDNLYNSNKNKILYSNQVMNKNMFLCNLINGKGLASGCSNKIYKKEIIKGIIFKNISVAEDLHFNYEIIKRNDNISVIFSDAKLYNYYVAHDASVMHGTFSSKNLDILEQYDWLLDDSKDNNSLFYDALKKSYVFISIKLIMKMVSSNYYNRDIYNKCIGIILKNKNVVLISNEYPIQKKIFLILFCLFYKNIISSYNKKNLFNKVCCALNKKVG